MDNDRKQDISLLQGATAALMEHFDTVQIFVTRHTNDGTVNVNLGSGNFFARRGQCQHWLEGENESSRMIVHTDESVNE